ncbi:MAG: UDP-N-acetylmuramate dehydrogenase [Bacteroidia bacterium]|nr:UDP-N-acetylmuramate dehydrogenase [Bacteroidia bacterium]
MRDKHTFHLNVFCKKLSYIRKAEDYNELLKMGFKKEKHLILGGGSNVLFTGDFDGWIAINQIKGKEILHDAGHEVTVRFGSGEVWHEVVEWCLEKDFGGIENLALIPGTVGAAPIQNIGAYGVEIKDVLWKVEGMDETGNEKTLMNEECQFGYRDSIFKNDLKNKFFITHVILRLSKGKHKLNYSYASLNEELKRRGIEHPTIQDIARAVIYIRQSKLPDPEKTGNAGSFFKNPTLSASEYEKFKLKFPDVPAYPSGESAKIPAAWLIEQCGYKGKTWKGAGVHEKQPLVLVNKNNARGTDILELCELIQEKVKEKFGIFLEPEVNIIR